MIKFFKDIKNVVILLLLLLFIIQIPQENFRFIIWMIASVFFAVTTELTIYYYHHKTVFVPKSAIITGFIVAGIISFQEPFWMAILFSIIAIASKHCIKIHKKHFLNPANTALLVATLFNIPLVWSLESNIYILIIAGLYFAYRLKKWGHILGFLIPFSVLILLRGTNPLLMISWFFLFIMLIEPKTSGIGFLRGLIFGTIASLSSFVILIFIPQYDFFVFGLFVANLCNPLLDKLFATSALQR